MNDLKATKYSRPVTSQVLDDWPCGARRTTSARFCVESRGNRGERVARQTMDPDTGQWHKPQRTTYGEQAVLVTGNDNRLYIILRVDDSCFEVFDGVLRHQRYVHREHEPDDFVRLTTLLDTRLEDDPVSDITERWDDES